MYESLPKKIWRVIYPVLLHIVIYVFVLLGAYMIFSSMPGTAHDIDRALNDNSALLTAIALVITIPVLYIFYKRDYPEWDKAILKSASAIPLLVVLAITLSHGLSLLISLIPSADLIGQYENIEQVIYSSSMFFVIIRAVILAPVCEELIFRGLMFRRLKGYTGFWVGAIISSAVFGLYHFNLLQGVFAFLFGIALCVVYDRYKNLFASVITHATANILSLILTYTGFQYPSTAIYIIVMILMLFIAAFLLRKYIKELKR